MNESLDALVTPRLLAITDLAQQAEAGADISLQLQAVVAEAVEDFRHVYNGRSLIIAFIHRLEAHGRAAKAERDAYAMVVLRAASMADRLARGQG